MDTSDQLIRGNPNATPVFWPLQNQKRSKRPRRVFWKAALDPGADVSRQGLARQPLLRSFGAAPEAATSAAAGSGSGCKERS